MSSICRLVFSPQRAAVISMTSVEKNAIIFKSKGQKAVNIFSKLTTYNCHLLENLKSLENNLQQF